MMPRVAVVTVVHGRHRHLRGQRWGLARQSRPADTHVVVAMGDPDVAAVLDDTPGPPAVVVDVPVEDDRLPLAAARNAGVEAARRSAADVVVLLDVDCVPAADLVERYVAALAPDVVRGRRPAVACGTVRYLDEETTARPRDDWDEDLLLRGSRPHPARPSPPEGAAVAGRDARLFWSLSFATTVEDWSAVGGFDEGYLGYGGEDTDFGQRVIAADGHLFWLGGGTAFHQHHGGGGLPVEHVDDIVTNGARFAGRWGWWPMQGWLDAFEDLGLVESDGRGGYAVTGRRSPRERSGR
ncbi:glycosyltransferase [Phycicoccus sp. BSK3Z-2]|uniref:Glycosyltransferase n=1 Tax=Phycicoccus avicenniae TaxID=2828860 RepID=A0A941HYF5_9MICO|nr:galactosyltransferase-related protein [Phycicoccus avicenniae]MBR7741787.1 glycosyltransferase [Phycicoccus avicenniae]